MKKSKITLAFLAIIITTSFFGCDNKGKSTETTAIVKETRIFTDSAGREVTIPTDIKAIAPSGPLAQIVLYTACPDKLGGLATDFSEDSKKYFDEKYWNLPKFGQFYGKNANLNMEALLKAAPDIIVDIGEAKKNVAEDMDKLQEQLGIPVIFVEANLANMDKTYNMLGKLVGEEKQGEEYAKYCKSVIDKANDISKNLKDNEKKSVYFALGKEGLNTNASGSFQAQAIEVAGGKNVAQVEVASSGGGTQISFEQLSLWQPDVIIVDTDDLYNKIISEPVWQDLEAVKNKQVYKIPNKPYSFMGNPPSINRIIGVQWLGNLLYPDKYKIDINKEVKEFCSKFYHIDLTDEQIAEILK